MHAGGWVVVSDLPLTAPEPWCRQPVCCVEFVAWQPVQCCVPADGSAHAVVVYGPTLVEDVAVPTDTVHPHVDPGSSVVDNWVTTEERVIDAAKPAPAESAPVARERTILPPPAVAEPTPAAPAPAAGDGVPTPSKSESIVTDKPLPLPAGPAAVPADGPLLPASDEQPVLEPIAADPAAAAKKTGEEPAAAVAPAETMPASPAPAPSPAEEPAVAEKPQPEPETPRPVTAEPVPQKPVERNLFDEVAEEEREEQAGEPAATVPADGDAEENDADSAEPIDDESSAAEPTASEPAGEEPEDAEPADEEAEEEDEDDAEEEGEDDDKQKDVDPFASILRTPDEPVRRWTDDTGLHETVGRLVEVHPDRVRILKSNGAHASVPLRRLSSRDRAYVFETGARVATGRGSPKAAPVDTAGL
ncbi:MAG: hypothetical protein EBZ59_04570 [Planctomycetia bacterium]|nr:hypothetical protein [Planctomycetia bacterium]